MNIFHGRADGAVSDQRNTTFTGNVWADPVMPTTDGVTINNVFFPPNCRTDWHTHEQGQVLQVIAGRGWVCREGEVARPLRAGDTVWISADENHWHGAAIDSYLLHTAISLGKTIWGDSVTSTQFKETTK